MIRPYFNFRLFYIIKIIFICLIFSSKSFSEESLIKKNTVMIGSSDAIVKIKIFSSLTCPHCADFHIKVIPQIKKEYVKSGKVQLILIDFPLDQASFNASKLLHCLSEKDQISFLDIIYENQNEWTNGNNIKDINNNLKKIVKNMGITPKKFDKCLLDETIGDRILNGRIEAVKKYSIDSTPTVIINEKKLKGSANFKNIKKKIEKII